MTRVFGILASLAVFVLASCSSSVASDDPSQSKAAQAPAQRGTTSNYAMPGDLKPNQVWVTSVPIGLQVYYGASWKEKKLRGTTPIVIDREVGANTVFVYSKVYPESELETTYGPTGQKVSVKDPPHTGVDTMMENLYRTDGNQETRLYIQYQLDSKDDKPTTIVALFQPGSATLKELDSLYPKGNNFVFDDAELKATLAQKHVPDTDMAAVISLLHRGGRIAISSSGKPVFYAEIGAKGAFSVKEP